MSSRARKSVSRSRNRRRLAGAAVQKSSRTEGPADLSTIVQRARQAPNSLTSQEVLHIQRATGNRSAGRLLTDAGGRQTAVRGQALAGSNGRVQRIMTAGVDHGTANLKKKERRKLENIRDDMARVGRKIKPAIAFTIKVVDQKDFCPASTNSTGITITVDLRLWYLKMATEGEILGMLAHELGVHTLANREMKEDDADYERKENRQLMTHKGGLEDLITSQIGITPLRGSVKWTGTKNEFVPTEHRQFDHIRIAQSVLYNTSSRAQKYLMTMLRMGDAIERSSRKTRTKTNAQKDLIKLFFVDIGRLLAADAEDAPVRTFKAGDLIAEVFNWYRDKVVVDHAGQHPWLNKKKLKFGVTGKGVKWFLIKQVLRYLGTVGLKSGLKAMFGGGG